MVKKIIEELEKLKIENAPIYYDDDYEQGYKQAMNEVIEVVKKYENDVWIKLPEERKEHRSEYYEFGSVGLAFEIGYNTCLKEVKNMNKLPLPYKGE